VLVVLVELLVVVDVPATVLVVDGAALVVAEVAAAVSESPPLLEATSIASNNVSGSGRSNRRR
jgi:hypothetical protein